MLRVDFFLLLAGANFHCPNTVKVVTVFLSDSNFSRFSFSWQASATHQLQPTTTEPRAKSPTKNVPSPTRPRCAYAVRGDVDLFTLMKTRR